MVQKCKKCGSSNLQKNGHNRYGEQKYRCKDCGYHIDRKIEQKTEYTAKTKPTPSVMQKPIIGISIDEFRKKHDVDYIVDETLKNLKDDRVYEKSDVIRLTGLRNGYPGLSQALEFASEYKGKAGGVTYWARPEIINELKEQQIMI